MSAKQTSFVAIMSSLGTVLSGLSLSLGPFLTAASMGAAALDLSHIATFIAAIFGGPYVGALVGFLGGVYAGYYFGYVAGGLGLLSLIGMPLGKMLTGLLAGFLYKKMKATNNSRSPILTIPLTLLSYVPEALYTVAYFLFIVPLVYKFSMDFMIPLVMPKAWLEISVMSLIMATLTSRVSFREFANTFFQPQQSGKASSNKT
jgi:LytS/YehU family sensor histidine kinase